MDDFRSQVAAEIRNHAAALSEEVLAFDENEAMLRGSDREPRRRRHTLEDTLATLNALADAISASRQDIFDEHIEWHRAILGSRGIDADCLVRHLGYIGRCLDVHLPRELAMRATDYLWAGAGRLGMNPEDVPPFIQPSAPFGGLAANYLEAMLTERSETARKLIHGALESHISARDLMMYVFEPVQHEIGRRWQTSRITVAQEHYCTAATKDLMAQLPYQVPPEPGVGRSMVATCIGGELHDVGIHMVSSFFRMEGWETCYLGADASAAAILKAARAREARVIAVSVTMTWGIKSVMDLICELRSDALLRRSFILVGGYAFNEVNNLGVRIGANAYAPNAEAAVAIAEELIRGAVA
jgi:methanogenic corrinoid protein MtbC1